MSALYKYIAGKLAITEESPKLSSWLPYEVYDEDESLFYNDKSYGFCVEVTPLCGADDSIVNTIEDMLSNVLEEGTSVQIYNWASPEISDYFTKWKLPRLLKNGVYRKLANKREEFFKKSNWVSLFNNPYVLRNFKVYIAVSIPYVKGKKGKTHLQIARRQIITTLKTAGMQAWNLEPNAFLGFLDEIVNPSIEPKNKHIEWDKLSPLKSELSNTEQSYYISENSIKVVKPDAEDIEIRSYSAPQKPAQWFQWANQDLIGDYYSDSRRMGCPFLQVFSFKCINQNDEINKINIKLLRTTRQIAGGLATLLPSLYEKESELKKAKEKITAGQKIIKSAYQILTFSRPEEADANESYLKAIFKSKGWGIYRDMFINIQSYLACMPFSFSEGSFEDLTKLARLKPYYTANCANIAPLQGEWKGHASPLMLLFGRRGQPFYWDPFSNDNGNYNISFIGKSGSGKSVAMQELVASLLGTGGQVIVIDDGRSFMNSCKLQGGTFVEFSTDGNVCLNPFSLVSEKVFEADHDYKEEVLLFINLLIRQMTKETEVTSDVENSMIGEAVSSVWEKYKTKGTVTKVSDYLLNNPDVRAQDLGLMLTKYTSRGLYARFFEGEANIALDNPFYVFEFDRLKSKPDLLKVVVMLVMFLAKEKAFNGDRSKSVSLVIDEAHSLLDGSQGAGACEAFARKSRKHKAQLITGTQSIDDYYKNSAGESIIQNTDWFCLLSQNPESIDSIKKSGRISMDEEKVKALKSLRMVDHQYSEMMIYNGGMGWAIGRLILDPFSIALYSSKGDDYRKIETLQQSGLNLEEAVETVANEIQNKRNI